MPIRKAAKKGVAKKNVAKKSVKQPTSRTVRTNTRASARPVVEKRAQPESLRARALGTSLTVRDLERSVDWYHRVVGFTVDQRYERDGKLRSVAVKAGDVRILLNQDDGAKGWDRVKGEGFSLQLTTVQDIDAIASRIKANGGTLDTEPADMPWGTRSFRVRDPDGFRWSISSPRQSAT